MSYVVPGPLSSDERLQVFEVASLHLPKKTGLGVWVLQLQTTRMPCAFHTKSEMRSMCSYIDAATASEFVLAHGGVNCPDTGEGLLRGLAALGQPFPSWVKKPHEDLAFA